MSILSKSRRALQMVGEQSSDVLLEPQVQRALAERYNSGREEFSCALYFADGPSNAYQVRQWFEPMRELAKTHPVAILARRPATAQLLAQDSPLPVFLARGIQQVEQFLTSRSVCLVFYVNNSQFNFTVLRTTGPFHVHLSHGESDKLSMASNQLKAYDQVFIAGEASRHRIVNALNCFDPQKLIEVGRPQLDFNPPSSTQPNGRTTVLYAPTWEGDRPAMEYGSCVSHGVSLAKSLLADRDCRLIFRPHPRTGSRHSEHKHAVQEITRLIANTVKRDPGSGHVRDRREGPAAAMADADFCICDISAMATDWLPQRKHMLITRPVQKQALVPQSGIASVVPLLEAGETWRVPHLIRDQLAHPVPERQLELIRYHFGDTSPGASTGRFIRAVEDLLAEAERVQAGQPEGK
ncbi:MAG: CDP-glycerol--glycerophosphate glycerophosphotransferase [Actinomycetota bacterium]